VTPGSAAIVSSPPPPLAAGSDFRAGHNDVAEVAGSQYFQAVQSLSNRFWSGELSWLSRFIKQVKFRSQNFSAR